MKLEDARNGIGKKVVYKPFEGCETFLYEYGTITSVNDKNVFVKYNYCDVYGVATNPEDLEFAEDKFEFLILDKTEISCFIDHEKRIIHILDLNNFGTRSLTNAISLVFERSLAKLLDLPQLMEYDWYCYGTDGLVTRYEDNEFYLLSEQSNLYPPFLVIMCQRLNKEYYSLKNIFFS